MMHWCYQLRDEASEFFPSHDRDVPVFSDSDVANDFAFLVDMFSHLNKLNTKLQCNKRLISDLYHHIVGFHRKVWEDLFEEAVLLRRFAVFKSVKDELCAFSAPLLTEVPIRVWVEVANMNSDLVNSTLFAPGLDILMAYQYLPPIRYPRLKAFASRYISMFDSNYSCSQG